MERIDPDQPDNPGNWANARNASDNGLFWGTPGERNSVSYTPPQATFSFSPDPAHPDESVLFTANATLDARSEAASYAWDFGDETIGRGQTFSHTYVQTGSYSILLTLRDDHGGESHVVQNIRVIVNALPRVDFSVRPSSQKRILQSLDPILFTDESYDPDGEVVSWKWNFGDGTTSTQQSPSHTYIGCGDYTVALDVVDNSDEHSYQTRSIRISSIAPVASYTFPAQLPNVGSEVIFDASGSFDRDGSIASYAWDVGNDGSVDYSSTLPTASLSFPHGGTHSVALQVTDDCGVISLPFVSKTNVNFPPKPAFQVSNFYPKQAETVQFTDQSHDDDGTLASWKWDFGDGSSQAGRSPQHAYSGAGTYSVTLTVTDDNGSEAAITSQITVANIPPTAHLTANGQEGKSDVSTGDTVTLDGSKSHDDKNPPRAGKIVSYHWDLDGDGTFEQETTCPMITHSYADDGTYKVRLQVTDDSGSTALSNQVTIVVHNRPPSVSFAFSPNEPTDVDEVTFTDASSDVDGTISSWQWTFGDGTVSTESNPRHTFPDDGPYDVSLIVTDEDGAASAAFTRKIIVTNAVPVAGFDLPTGAHTGDQVSFHDRSHDMSPAGEIVHVAWDFGDGTFCPGSVGGCDGGDTHNPIHIYDAAGTYTVSLVVIDDDGALASVTHTITVAE
ncbi:MAG: PKD domain-containing protein [Nitrospirae bacterium]|nr:PKD domain-containing protein [Nitrospirota bacterium]